MMKRVISLTLILVLWVALVSMSVTAAQNLDTASTWARDGIAEAIGKGFVPADIQSDYQDTITRAEFCRMAVKWVEYALDKDIEAVLTAKGLSRDKNPFTDTDDLNILAAYVLGITAGTGEGRFSPDGYITREQAATMIMNTCRTIGWGWSEDVVYTEMPLPFYDIDAASDWARRGISFVQIHCIMSGTGNNNFSSKAVYTREQSIVTFNNIRPLPPAQGKIIYYYDDASWDQREFDDFGREWKATTYNPGGSVKFWYVNEYDDFGNVKATVYDYSNAIAYSFEIEYDANGRSEKYTRYHPDGSIDYWHLNEYDDDGNLTRMTVFNPDGSTSGRVEFKDGRTYKNTTYNPDGSVMYEDTFD